MARRGRTAAAAAAAASRCRSRCELRRAAGFCRHAGLLRRAKAAGSTSPLAAGCGCAGCLGHLGGGFIHVIFFAAFAAAGRGSRAHEAKMSASAAGRSSRAGSRRSWLRLPCVGVCKHAQTASRPSPPCPRNPCLPLLSVRTTPAAAVSSSHLDPPQVQLSRRLDSMACALWRRLAASERARRPCCCGAALQLAGGGAGCTAAVPRSGPPEPAPGGCRWPRATRAPASLCGRSRAPGGAPEGGRGMAGARRPCAPAPGRVAPVPGRSTYRRRQVGGALRGRTRLARAVRVLSVCLVVRGGRSVCYAGTSLTVEMALVVY